MHVAHFVTARNKAADMHACSIYGGYAYSKMGASPLTVCEEHRRQARKCSTHKSSAGDSALSQQPYLVAEDTAVVNAAGQVRLCAGRGWGDVAGRASASVQGGGGGTWQVVRLCAGSGWGGGARMEKEPGGQREWQVRLCAGRVGAAGVIKTYTVNRSRKLAIQVALFPLTLVPPCTAG